MLPKVRHQSSKAEPSVVNEDIVKDHALSPEDVQSIGQARTTSRDLFSLKGRTIVVTGAGRGLGIALAAGVLRAGGDVVCLDVLPKPSEIEWADLEDIAKDTNKAKYHQCDITQEEEVKKILNTAAAEASARGNPIRGLISCAGIQQMVDAVDYPINDFKRIFDVNVTGSFVVAKSIAGLMKEANTGGSLVLIASMSGQIANRVSPAISLLKTRLMRSLGNPLLSLQLIQSRSTANESITCHGMGPTWHQGEQSLAWVYQDSNDCSTIG
jgi:NAD(P)-dependent dehydrogenase (short-subunit alcohol dehydrogenase family)